MGRSTSRASSIAEGDISPGAFGAGVVLAVLMFLASLACSGTHLLASVKVVSSSHHSHELLRADDQLALGESVPEPARVRQHNVALPSSERDVLEPDDSEQLARLEAASPCVDVTLTPLVAVASETLRVASSGWMPEFLLSPALPRGPPSPGC